MKARHRSSPSGPALAAAAILLAALLCQARAAAGSSWEIAPWIGYHAGGGFDDNNTGAGLDAGGGAALGVVVGYPESADGMYELFYGYQRTRLFAEGAAGAAALPRLDVHYMHIGGSYRFAEGAIRPFVSGGLGGTHFSPGAGGGGSRTYFSLSLGLGAMVPLSRRVELRLEGRGFLTILPENTQLFCVSAGGAACRVDVRGDAFGQFLLTAGAVFLP